MSEQSISESETTRQPTPEFDAGFVTIPHLSTDPKGFTIEPGTSLSRRDQTTQGLPLSDEQRNQLRSGMASEAFFTLPKEFPQEQKPLVKQYFNNINQLALLKPSGETTADYSSLLAQQHVLREQLRPLFHQFKLTEQLGLKVGVRNIVQKDNVLTVDTRPVSYPMYAVGASPEESAETLDMSAVTGTAAILVTADNKIILQHRSSKNSPYGDMPGASIAGMLDGTLKRERDETTGEITKRTGTLEPIDTDSVKQSSLTESEQEIALTPSEFTDFRIVGEARDHVREHDEFLLLAKTALTSQEVAEKAASAPRSRNPRKLDEHGDFHFEENFITIDATPEAIGTLLTEVKCPLPPTHAAAFVAAGYNLILERSGIQAANEWKDRMQEGVKRNYQEMNKLVSEYYEANPTELENNKPGKPKRNPTGYEPYYTPQEQGLPPLGPELIRTGLLH